MNDRIVEQRESGEYCYSLTSADIRCDNEDVTVYGICIFNRDEQAVAPDISCDLREVRELFDLAVQEQLYPEHLLEVVEDHLSCYHI